ncbi:uncharacterized protein Dana_GF22522 [Drosophila ananassae]|uniref:BHLH domain-containing protein n=1 Tax=Drosophila ananassae TaxID=7217 RepID=B3MWM0_DROAN|nr:enhancer of split mgamma protein [Drosophila ananassae]EDV35005.1 uncharacterized protein Dana_GF22522 [Drosophila ananassae]
MSTAKSQEEVRRADGGSGAMSRTYQYRKVMKPLLERKRRARINRCLEELKLLIKETAYMDSEALAKLEKADILELTVHHLQDRRRHQVHPTTTTTTPAQFQRLAMERYWNGFRQCALEVSRFLQRHDRQLNEKFLEAMEQYLPTTQPLPLPLPIWRPWKS